MPSLTVQKQGVADSLNLDKALNLLYCQIELIYNDFYNFTYIIFPPILAVYLFLEIYRVFHE